MLKTVSSVINAIGALNYRGTWDAATNDPTLTSSVGTKGDYYVVSVAGSTNLNGITDWQINDWAIFNGSVWEKIDNTDLVVSVNGQTGAVVLSASNVGAAANTVTIIAGTGLGGGGNLESNVNVFLANTTVSSGSYGSNTSVATFTVDAQGRLTAAANVAIDFSGGISGNVNVDSVTFNTAANITVTEAQLAWNDEDRISTLDAGLKNNLVYHLGEELYFRVKLDANTTKGQVMMFTGTLGSSGGLKAAPATGLTPEQSNYILGIATESGVTNDWIYVTYFGEVFGVNTTGGGEGWVNGTVLYYNPSVTGGLTKNKPSSPNAIAVVAAVVNANANGILFVRPTYGSVLGGTDGNVNFTSLANNNVIVYNGTTNVWVNSPNVNLSNITGANVTVTANLYANLATSNTAAMPDPSLPLNPEGYVEIVINGATKKVPYYGV